MLTTFRVLARFPRWTVNGNSKKATLMRSRRKRTRSAGLYFATPKVETFSHSRLSHGKIQKPRSPDTLITALEIFPDGLAVWDHNTTRMTIEAITISTRERRLSIRRRVPVLEYSFISEAKTRPNIMANGRAWFESDYIIFVQHTSSSPISPSVVDGVARDCSRLSDPSLANAHEDGG